SKMLEKEARKYKKNAKELLASEQMHTLLSEYGSSKVEDLLSAIGYGKLSAKQVITRLSPEELKEAPAEAESMITSVVKRVLGIGGEAELLIRGVYGFVVF